MKYKASRNKAGSIKVRITMDELELSILKEIIDATIDLIDGVHAQHVSYHFAGEENGGWAYESISEFANEFKRLVSQ